MKTKTAKIKVTVTRKEVKELEITFPYCTKEGNLYCKFLSKDDAIWLYDYRSDSGVKFSKGAVPESWITNEPITEGEFNQKFNEIMNALISISNEKTI